MAGVLLALATAAASPAQAAPSHRLLVVHGRDVVWTFHTAACKRSKHRFTAVLGGEVRNPDYALAVHIDGFSGFHRYAVTLGPSLDGVFLKLFGPGDAVYSNFYRPPYPVPGAGRVTFGNGGRVMGVGFGPAMFSADGSDGVVLAGAVTCKYPKR